MRDALAALRPPNPRHAPPERTGDRPKGLNVLGTLAHHPSSTRAFHTFNGHVLFGTTLTPRQRELLVLRVAAVRGCRVRVGPARRAGRRRRHRRPTRSSGSPQGADAAGLVAARPAPWCAPSTSCSPTPRIGDATWAVLAAELDEQQLMDVVFTVGAYDLLAMAFRVVRRASWTTTCVPETSFSSTEIPAIVAARRH